MVGPPRGPARPPMAPQPPAQPHHQLIIKQVGTPLTMVAKPPAPNYVNYLSLPVMPSNGNYLAVTSKPGDTNGTTILTMTPRPTITENNNSATYIAMDSAPQSHHYLFPRPEPFAMHNYSKNEPPAAALAAATALPSAPGPNVVPPNKRRSPNATRATNHQRIKEEVSDEEGEEVRPLLDPGLPFQEQVVRIDHSYPHYLPIPSPREDDKESTISSDEKVDHNEEGEETETAAEGEDSVTRCICNLEHDDGYMISCDQCYVWQHVACVLPDIPVGNSLPDMAYLCDICQPRELDRHRARALQIQRRKQLLHRDDSSDDSWSSADRPAPPPKKAVARRRAEAIPRRPNKRDSSESPMKHKSDMRPRKLDSLLGSPMRSKLLKVGSKGRRDSTKSVLTPPSLPPPAPLAPSNPSVGRRTKLKRKFESKANQRRKSKSKDGSELKMEKDVERRRSGEVRTRSATDRLAAKSRCRLMQSATGEPMIVTTCRVAIGEPLVELRGKYLQSSVPAPKADVLFHYRFPKDGTEVLMDGSGRENIVRHARACCNPNAQLKHCLVKGSLRLYLVAIETLDRNQQVTIPHGCVTESATAGMREVCGKDCTYNPNNTAIAQKMSPRRRSRRCTVSEESDREGEKDTLRSLSPLSPTHSERDRKLTREEKKIEQAMKIFAQMEKDTARKRDKPPGAVVTGGYRRGVDSDKESPVESGKPRRRRRRRKRRNSRKSRIPSGSGAVISHSAHSGDESDMSSGDELASPHEKRDSKDSGREDDDDKIVGMNDAAGLLLALGGVRHRPPTTPPASELVQQHSENDSSPSTPLSSACLLVAAAVGPLAPGFKFPKTKKILMNEYLGKSPEHVPADLSPSTELGPPVPPCDLSLPSVPPSHMSLPPGAPKLSNLSNRLYYPSREHCAGFAGFGKKRWLRQAISEETETPLGSPPCPPDNVTPLKKRRLARESLTSEPPATPPPCQTPTNPEDDAIFGGEESPRSPVFNSGTPCLLTERLRAMHRDYLTAQGIDDADGAASTAPVAVAAPSAKVYDTSPQRVPENLTLPRTVLPPSESTPSVITPTHPSVSEIPTTSLSPRNAAAAPGSPTPASPVHKPGRKGRKRPAPRVDNRTSPRVKRWTQKSGAETIVDPQSNGRLEDSSENNSTEVPKTLKDEIPVKSDANKTRLAFVPNADERLSIKEIDEKPVHSLTNEVKTELSVFCDVKVDMFGTSNMDLLALEATRELRDVKLGAGTELEKPIDVTLGTGTELQLLGAAAEILEPAELKQNLMVEVHKPVDVKEDAVVDTHKLRQDKKDVSAEEQKPSLTEVKAEAPSPVEIHEDKAAPIRRKLSITEYLKRKKGSGPKIEPKPGDRLEPETKFGFGDKPRPASPPSDDDISPLLMSTPSLPLPFMDGVKGGRFKLEPTELERQRENLNERLRREFGLAITDDDSPKLAMQPPLPALPPLPPLSPPPPKLSPPLDRTSPNLSHGSPPPRLSPPARLFTPPPRLSSPSRPLSPPALELNGFPESKMDLPQSAIYPVGSSNPPNPFVTPYPAPERRKFRK